MIKSEKISIAYDTYIEDWSEANAKQECITLLNLSGNIPDVILSSNDGMAFGIIGALEDGNVQLFPIITGQDAELKACLNIINRRQSITIYKPLKLEAETAAILATKLSDNKNITNINTRINNGKMDIPIILLDPILVDKNNLKSTIIADGFHSEKDIFQ